MEIIEGRRRDKGSRYYQRVAARIETRIVLAQSRRVGVTIKVHDRGSARGRHDKGSRKRVNIKDHDGCY
jgi:hypothetical protein